MNSNTLQQIAQAFDYLFDSLVVTDLNGIIKEWNKGSEKLYGYSKEEAIGQPVSILHVPEDSNHITTEVISAVEKLGKWSGEVRMLHKDGSIGWIESMCVPFYDDSNNIIGALGINRDITARMTQTEHLQYLANYDHLTQIPNRHLLFDRINHIITQSKRNNSSFALLYIDLDNFKIINDTLGHAVGDQVLVETSKRLQQLTRESDTVARIGGDEFIVLLENVANKNNVSTMVEMIISTLNKSFTIGKDKLIVGCSIGVSTYPYDGITTDALIAAADAAMYNTKHNK